MLAQGRFVGGAEMRLIDTKLYTLLMRLWDEAKQVHTHDRIHGPFHDVVEQLDTYKRAQQEKSHLSG
jgi:hypothetical protein